MRPVFRTENSPLQIYFLELDMEILMQQLLNNNQKICCWLPTPAPAMYFSNSTVESVQAPLYPVILQDCSHKPFFN